MGPSWLQAMSMRPPICEMVSQHICSAASVSFDEPALTDDVTDMRPPNGKTEWTAMRFAGALSSNSKNGYLDCPHIVNIYVLWGC